MLTEIGVALLAGFLGAILKDHLVKPLREYREIRKRIAKDLIIYSNLITSPGSGSQNKIDEAAYELSSDAAELRAIMEDLPRYTIWSLFFVPSPSTLKQIEDRLTRLLNSIYPGSVNKNKIDKQK